MSRLDPSEVKRIKARLNQETYNGQRPDQLAAEKRPLNLAARELLLQAPDARQFPGLCCLASLVAQYQLWPPPPGQLTLEEELNRYGLDPQQAFVLANQIADRDYSQLEFTQGLEKQGADPQVLLRLSGQGETGLSQAIDYLLPMVVEASGPEFQ
jgi:hypothetical protein